MNEQQVQISDSAAARIAFLMAQEASPDAKLRVAVDGGGCSGFQYRFDFDQEQKDDDILLEKEGAKVLIDTMSLEFMQGSVIDYIETLGAAHFEVRNPQASATCGCGNSFAV